MPRREQDGNQAFANHTGFDTDWRRDSDPAAVPAPLRLYAVSCAPLLLPWLLASLWIGFRHPEQRALRASKAAIWLCCVSLIVGVHLYLAIQTRDQAQLLVEKVIAYQQTHGRYPDSAQALGYSDKQLRELLGLGGYFLTEGKPTVFYATTYLPFETESYDFSRQQWQHQGR